MVAKGKTSKVDLARYETTSSSFLSFLTFSWAIIADIDIESEAIRWAGFARMDIWGVWRVLNLRTYRAKFSYLPPSAKSYKLSPLTDPIPKDGGWKTMEDDFVLFWASQVTHAAELTHHAPQCKPDDGIFVVFIVRYVGGNVASACLTGALP
jgi:sphingosine kinase